MLLEIDAKCCQVVAMICFWGFNPLWHSILLIQELFLTRGILVNVNQTGPISALPLDQEILNVYPSFFLIQELFMSKGIQ